MQHGSTYLVAVAGMQPQRTIEAFYALAVAAKPPLLIKRIDIIGTEPVWNVHRAELANKNGAFALLARRHRIPMPELRFHLLSNPTGTHPLEDLRTTEDNMAAWRQVLQVVHTLILESDVLVGTAGGARQGLRQALTLAFQLLARPQDRLVDIRTSGSLLLGPTKRKRHAQNLPEPIVNELPFLRIQELPRRADALDLQTLVAAVQPKLEFCTKPSLEFQLDPNGRLAAVIVNGRSLWPNNSRIRLRKRDLAIWLHLAQLRKAHRLVPKPTSPPSPERAAARGPDFESQPTTLLSCDSNSFAPYLSPIAPATQPLERGHPCPCCFREAAELAAFVPDSDRDLPDEYVRQATSRIKRALSQFGLTLAHCEAVRFRGAGNRPNTAYGIHLDPEDIVIRQVGT